MPNDRDNHESTSGEPGAPRDANAPSGVSRAEITNAVANGIDAVFGAGFARQIHEQAQARGAAAPAPAGDALAAYLGSLSDSDKQALLLNQRAEFNLQEDRRINALLGLGDPSSEEAMKAFFERVKTRSPSTGSAPQNDAQNPSADRPAPRKPSA